MSKQLLVVVAGAVLIWGAYTVSDRLMADPPTPTQNQPVPGAYPSAANTFNAPPMVAAGPVPDPNYYNLPANHGLVGTTTTNNGPAQSSANSQFVQPYSPPAGVVVDQSSGRELTPTETAAVQRAEVAFAGGIAPGTFSVVSDGKRSIMVNTSTGESWLLMIDNPGSHWEPIGMGISKGDSTEISWSAAPAGVADLRTAAPSENREAVRLEQSEKHVRRLNIALDLETERNSDLEKSLAEANLEIRRLTDGVFKYRDEVAELNKELREAKKALTARPELAPAQPDSTSEDANPFE